VATAVENRLTDYQANGAMDFTYISPARSILAMR
jgi:hypothetical protein